MCHFDSMVSLNLELEINILISSELFLLMFFGVIFSVRSFVTISVMFEHNLNVHCHDPNCLI